jgi:photosystem II stability/assembly factor-like uncharacterized protein
MKKLLFFSAMLVGIGSVNAQPWLEGIPHNKQLNLLQITEAYNAKMQPSGSENESEAEEREGNAENEGKHYHFDRWKYYWEAHTDENGNLVSPLRVWNELKAFEKIRSKTANKTTATDQSNWSFFGPSSSAANGKGLGRINIVEFHPVDSNIFWIGSAGGGAWKTADGGLNWAPVNDFLPILGVSDIDFNPLNPNTIYMCTGDRDASDNFSIGVLKSYDGGATWDTTGLKCSTSDNRLTNSLLINPVDTNSITLAASNAIYKSYDGGTTWAVALGGTFKQLVAHPTDTSVIYASGFSGGTHQVYRSADGGATWAAATNFPTNSRITIAVTPANPAIVKLVVAKTDYGLEGIYNSTDTGKTFTKIFDDGTNCANNILANTPNGNQCGGQGWYDLSIAISPVDENQVVVGGVNTWYSVNGGSSWVIASQWASTLPGIQTVHADKHYHRYSPLMKNTLFECNDGGIYKTTSPTSLWNDLTNGICITQFYRNAVTNMASFIVGGAQDNGSKKMDAPNTHTELTGGDGMDCQVDYTDPKIIYTSIQYGELRRSLNGGANFTDIQSNIPGKPAGDWITPIVLHPDIPNYILAGYRKLYVSPDKGDTWSEISPTQTENIKRIATCFTNSDHIYIVASNTIKHSTDFGTTWVTIPLGVTGTISDIQVDPKDENHIWISYNGFATNKVAEYSPTIGWKAHNDLLPNIPVHCIAIDSSKGTVYIGTDIGTFFWDTNLSYWQPFNKNLPTVEVADLGINYTSGELCAATYGRGMWKSPLYDPAIAANVGNIPLANNVINIYPNPNNGHFNINTSNKALQGSTVAVRIISLTGAVAWQNNVSFTTSGIAAINADLPRGTYIVEVNKNNLLFAKEKIVIY